ncbi:MAG: SH3 domain-containing protein [Anaerolineales bacterium]|nr:SH3 domain-containing protein [Anaerolineales bacterium]
MMKRFIHIVLVLLCSGLWVSVATAQTERVAILEVLHEGVEVKRAGTNLWIPISVESIVGVGDSIRTDATGEARITFFGTGADTELEPKTEFMIRRFEGDEDSFTISIEVLSGITRQQVSGFLDLNSSYELITPGMAMTVRGTEFAVRVEDTGRSSLVTSQGVVAASAELTSEEIAAGFGVRAPVGERLSAVVPATSFDELDAALDGVAATFETAADIRLNVRVGPGIEYERVGSIDPAEIDTVLGIDETGVWYRIAFRDGFAWVSGELIEVAVDLDKLPRYNSDFTENITLYTSIGDAAADAVVGRPIVNLRAGPDETSAIISQVFDGDILTVLGKNRAETWLYVRTLDGRRGWMSAPLLQVNIDLSRVDIISIDATPIPSPVASPTPSATPTDGAEGG